jgi:hypothetical protein
VTELLCCNSYSFCLNIVLQFLKRLLIVHILCLCRNRWNLVL